MTIRNPITFLIRRPDSSSSKVEVLKSIAKSLTLAIFLTLLTTKLLLLY